MWINFVSTLDFLFKKWKKQMVHFSWILFNVLCYLNVLLVLECNMSVNCQLNNSKCSQIHFFVIIYKDRLSIFLRGCIFILVSLCPCREVTGVGAELQSSVSHTGTADAAVHPALPWSARPHDPTHPCWIRRHLLAHITKTTSPICGNLTSYK